MWKNISLDLREWILTAYDEGERTREVVARRFRVSLGMVRSCSNSAVALATFAPTSPLWLWQAPIC